MTNYYTIIGKSVKCPQYKKDIVLNAKYRYTGNPENEHEISFAYATCPIVEKSKLHKDNQCEEYKYLQCFQKNCEHLYSFPEIHDDRKEL